MTKRKRGQKGSNSSTLSTNTADAQTLPDDAHNPPDRSRGASQASGNWNPDWEPFAKLDPAWTDKAIAMAIAPAVTGSLDKKTLELIGIALDASCTNMYAPGVRRHIQRALNVGATKEEIIAVLQLASLQGLHSMCLGAPILLEELEANERRKA
jgi:alkylhydroperoxidase/carboxymuconolactone decarboxylase family protein YurZ